MKQLSGKWDKEKEEFVNEEIERFNQLDNTLTIAQAQFSDGEISEQEVSTTARFVADSKVSYDGFEKLLDQVELMKLRSPQEQVLVHESGYELLLGKSYFGLSNELMQTSIFISSLIILLVPFMAEEYESDMINIIKTTRNGRRKLLSIKIALGLFLTIVMFLVSFIPTIIAINASYPLGQLYASISAIPAFSHLLTKLNISIGGYLALIYLIKFTAAVLTLLLAYLLACRIKKSNVAISLALSITVFPLLLRMLGIEWVDYITFNAFYSGNILLDLVRSSFVFALLILPIGFSFLFYRALRKIWD